MSLSETGEAEKPAWMSLTLIIFFATIALTSGVGLLPEDSVAAAVGGSVTFNTSLAPTETPLYNVVWNVGARNIVTLLAGVTAIDPAFEGRISLSTFTGSLELRNVALSDTGEYSVDIRATAADEAITGSTTLNIYEPVSNVTVRANSTDLVEFSSVRLSCSASGSSLSFLWFKDSVEVTASDRVHFTDGGATLTIVTVWRSDHGSYTVRVSDPVSSATSDEEVLFVSYGPDDVTLTTSPSHEYHHEGSDISLSCSADSRPAAEFRWFLNEQTLPSTGAQTNMTNIQMEQSGNYSCHAFNNKTLKYTTSQPVQISVLERITNTSVKSSNPPVEGTSVNLTCDASGSIFTRDWMINGTELKPSENIMFYEENRVLSFRNLSRGENGKYTCNISNPVSSQTFDYEMNVNYGPDSVQISGPVEVQKGTTLKLSCSADSVPTAKFTWTKSETTLGQSSEFTKEKMRLSDGGEYICRATNEITKEYLEESHAVAVSDQGLSAGAIAGITVASLVVVAGAAGGAFYMFKHKPCTK